MITPSNNNNQSIDFNHSYSNVSTERIATIPARQPLHTNCQSLEQLNTTNHAEHPSYKNISTSTPIINCNQDRSLSNVLNKLTHLEVCFIIETKSIL